MIAGNIVQLFLEVIISVMWPRATDKQKLRIEKIIVFATLGIVVCIAFLLIFFNMIRR
jgi:hypothetical protein